jgi:transcriptional regulator with XRE-family HTH domain
MPLSKYKSINGEDLRRLRNLKGLKQSSVVTKLGISRQAYSKTERSQNVSIQKAYQILTALNCTVEDFEKIINFNSPYRY